jgi:hypothetical protein
VFTEEQPSLVRFLLWEKDSTQRIFLKKYFLLTIESFCPVELFTTGSGNSLKDVRKSEMMPYPVRKWLKQQSKDFCAVDFDALVKL